MIWFQNFFDSILLVSHSGRAYFIGKGKAPSLVAQEEKNLVGPLVTDQCTYIPYCRIGLVQKSFSNNIFHSFLSRALLMRWKNIQVILKYYYVTTHYTWFVHFFMQIKCILEIMSIFGMEIDIHIRKVINCTCIKAQAICRLIFN